MEIYDEELEKEDQPAMVLIREVAQLMSLSYENEENYKKQIEKLL
jgi:hypothetical protein